MQTTLRRRVLPLLGFSLLLFAPAAQAAESDAIAPDIRPEALKDLRQMARFKTIDNPKLVPASEASFLRDDDYVLAVSVGGESRAYPTRFLWWHHGINDRIGDLPFAVTYCSVCNTGIGYDLRLDGKPIALDFYGLYNGVVTLCDRESGTVFLQADGRFVKGTLTGKRLKHVPVLDTTWAQWKKLHPDTQVMSPDTPYKEFYRPTGSPEPRGRDRLSPFFVSTITRGDLRLGQFEKVLGVALTAADDVTAKTGFRAYPLKAVQEAGGVVNDTAGDLSLAVFLEPATQTAVAVSRQLEGRTLTFESRKEGDASAIFDRETGSRWSLAGKAESGPLAGKSLTLLVGNLSQWYGWAAYFPETSIYGRTDPPRRRRTDALPHCGRAALPDRAHLGRACPGRARSACREDAGGVVVWEGTGAHPVPRPR
jgi:hypothetical protein